ncbi:hypothetical protein M407DRAFT_242841, partial [Tulasnella calospora MUT 4182]
MAMTLVEGETGAERAKSAEEVGRSGLGEGWTLMGWSDISWSGGVRSPLAMD